LNNIKINYSILPFKKKKEMKILKIQTKNISMAKSLMRYDNKVNIKQYIFIKNDDRNNLFFK